jgi:protein-S-isoprenylcysteine O-methyltransferase Ste14
MRAVLTLFALLSFAVYGVAIQRLFVRPDGIQPGMRLLAISGLVSAMLHTLALALAPLPGLSHQSVALLLYATGLGLFVWAWRVTRSRPLPMAFSLSAPERLVVRGPYTVLRHPMYTAYTLTWAAGVVATLGWLPAASAVWMVYLYRRAARIEEATLLRGPTAEAYARYAGRVSGWPFGKAN